MTVYIPSENYLLLSMRSICSCSSFVGGHSLFDTICSPDVSPVLTVRFRTHFRIIALLVVVVTIVFAVVVVVATTRGLEFVAALFAVVLLVMSVAPVVVHGSFILSVFAAIAVAHAVRTSVMMMTAVMPVGFLAIVDLVPPRMVSVSHRRLILSFFEILSMLAAVMVTSRSVFGTLVVNVVMTVMSVLGDCAVDRLVIAVLLAITMSVMRFFIEMMPALMIMGTSVIVARSGNRKTDFRRLC